MEPIRLLSRLEPEVAVAMARQLSVTPDHITPFHGMAWLTTHIGRPDVQALVSETPDGRLTGYVVWSHEAPVVRGVIVHHWGEDRRVVRQFLEAGRAWATSLGAQRLLMRTHRRPGGWMRRYGWAPAGVLLIAEVG